MLNLVRAWLVFSAVMCSAGWGLSLLQRLDAAGYAVVLALLGAGMVWWARAAFAERPWRARWQRIFNRRRRFRRALPLVFFILATAVVVGGLLHPPVHADALQYRTPRVLHWLSAGQWHWIHAWDQRLNVISCGFEWLTAPLLALTRTDRGLFLVNACSYVLLPGLVFGVLKQLGVNRRVAWNWMWILPSGWVYCLQAGGLGNDQFAAVYSLAAVYFGMRARQSGRLADVWFSLLAGALITGTKQTNLPLALLGVIAVWPALRLLWRRPVASLGVALLALSASAAPMIGLDLYYTGYWTGWSPAQSLQPASPLIGVAGNAFVLTLYNFMPPVFPFANQWNVVRTEFLQSSWGEPFRSFEMFANMPRAAAEQTAALGIVVSLLVLVAFLAGWKKRGAQKLTPSSWRSAPRLIRAASWCLLLLFMAKVGSWNAPRYLAAYYPFLLPTFLLGAGQVRVVRSRWWRRAALAGMILTTLMVVFSRQRPVWPMQTTAKILEQQFPHSKLVQKIGPAYRFPASLSEPLEAGLLEKIPATEKVIGYATRIGGLDRQLWFPLGERRVEYVRAEDAPDRLRVLGVTYLLVDAGALQFSNLRLEDWLQRYDAELIATMRRSFGPDLPVLECHLLRLPSAGPASK